MAAGLSTHVHVVKFDSIKKSQFMDSPSRASCVFKANIHLYEIIEHRSGGVSILEKEPLLAGSHPAGLVYSKLRLWNIIP